MPKMVPSGAMSMFRSSLMRSVSTSAVASRKRMYATLCRGSYESLMTLEVSHDHREDKPRARLLDGNRLDLLRRVDLPAPHPLDRQVAPEAGAPLLRNEALASLDGGDDVGLRGTALRHAIACVRVDVNDDHGTDNERGRSGHDNLNIRLEEGWHPTDGCTKKRAALRRRYRGERPVVRCSNRDGQVDQVPAL